MSESHGAAAPLVIAAMAAAVIAACGGAKASASASAGASAKNEEREAHELHTGCEGCHAEIAAEWRSSFHRAAFTDATFQRSLELEDPADRAFCTGCHAPAASRTGVATGVDCAACHGERPRTPEQRRAGTPSRPPARAPHDVTVDAAFGTAKACAPCHEFAFADGRPDLVQKTLSEHAESGFADVSCAACHMPRREGHMDHRFLSGHSPEHLKAAVHVEGSRSGARGARITIRVDAGHAFPTGDMFRRARLLVLAEGELGQIVGSSERAFGRTWGGVTGGIHAGKRSEVGDTRIRGTWSELLDLAPDAPIVRVRYVLSFERVLAMRGPHVAVASTDVIAEGELR